jgi:ABC-type multidrug transport system fused ATPase/permease subunit
MIAELRRRVRLLAPAARARWAMVAPLAFLTAILEGLGGALVFALLSVLLVPPSAAESRLLQFFRARIAGSDPRGAVLTLVAIAAVIHITRNLLVVGTAWWRARLIAFDTAALSTRLLDAYVMRVPWPVHLRRNSAVLIENVRERSRPFFEVFDSASTIVTETAVVIALVAVAGSVAPAAVTTIAAGIALVLVATLRLTRDAQRRGGIRQFGVATSMYHHVQHSLGALKEVRILGRGAFFVAAFARAAQASARLDTTRATLDTIPRLLLETVFVLGMLALVAAGAAQSNATSVLPIVSLYAYTGFRIIPAAHRIATSVNTLRWNLASTEPLVEDLRALERPAPAVERPAARMEFRDRLQADHLTFTYEGTTTAVLRDVSFSIRSGESIAIVGASGAGKSTLVDLLIGLLPPSDGRVIVDGVGIETNLPGWQQNIGYVPQTPFLLDDTLRRNIAFGLPDAEIDDAALGRALGMAQLQDVVARLPDGVQTIVGERGIRLSGGERQRISIARALYRDPTLVVFDEATSSLDPGTERDVARAIEPLHGTRTIIVIAHRLTTVERCDRVLLLREGRLEAAGTYAELAASNPAFRSVAALDRRRAH